MSGPANREPYDSDAAIRVGVTAREQIETRWGLILVIFMRFARGLVDPAGPDAMGDLHAAGRCDLRSTHDGAAGAIMFFAVIDLLAAVGLWLATPWGGVLWLLASVSQIFVTLGVRHVFGAAWIVADLTLILIYFALTWQAGRVAEEAYAPSRSSGGVSSKSRSIFP